MIQHLLASGSVLALASCSIAASSAASSSDGLAEAIQAEIIRLQAEADVSGVGVVVVRGDQIVLSDGFGVTQSGEPFSATTSCGLYSATKALTAFTTASLMEDGVIDIDQSIGQAWPQAPDHWAEIPVWRLYNHTSGIPMIINQPAFAERAEDPDWGNHDIINILVEQPLDYAPGEYSRYRQSGYGLAEWMAEQATGSTWPELVEAHLTGPANATQTYHGPSVNGDKAVPMLTSAGNYQTTPEDMGAILLALNSGAVAGTETIREVLLNPAYVHDGYGLGLIHETVEGEPTIGHRGGGARGNVRYAPAARIGVMACTDQTPNNELTIQIAEMALTVLLTGEPPASGAAP